MIRPARNHAEREKGRSIPAERDMAAELARLRAIVETLERLLASDKLWHSLLHSLDGGYYTDVYDHQSKPRRFPTLAEALSAAVAAMDETKKAGG